MQLPLKNICDIYVGKGPSSAGFSTELAARLNPDCCFTLVGEKESKKYVLDLCGPSAQITKDWLEGLRRGLYRSGKKLAVVDEPQGQGVRSDAVHEQSNASLPSSSSSGNVAVSKILPAKKAVASQRVVRPQSASSAISPRNLSSRPVSKTPGATKAGRTTPIPLNKPRAASLSAQKTPRNADNPVGSPQSMGKYYDGDPSLADRKRSSSESKPCVTKSPPSLVDRPAQRSSNNQNLPRYMQDTSASTHKYTSKSPRVVTPRGRP